jgi:hypothetical protein
VKAYNADHTHFYTIPSEHILVTKGSTKYIALHNAHGPYTKYRFQLCWENLAGGCRFKDQCSFIHSMATTDNIEVTDVHYGGSESTSAQQHPTHPAGWTLSVFLPNSQSTCETIPSEFLFYTQGSIAALNNLLYNPGARRAQHCAHFYLNNMCTRGSMCNFVHAMKPTSPQPVEGCIAAGLPTLS